MMLFLAVVFWFIPAALCSLDRMRVALTFALAAVVYVVTIGAIFGALWANNRLAERNAVPVIVAIDRFEAEHGRYPESLEQLIPVYINAIPSATFTVGCRRFTYKTIAGREKKVNARLSYCSVWPGDSFPGSITHFECDKRRWFGGFASPAFEAESCPWAFHPAWACCRVFIGPTTGAGRKIASQSRLYRFCPSWSIGMPSFPSVEEGDEIR